ncbi:replication fork protection component Swi3-domain-containing protein [Butyriboletus roseoflavus]|nr:replication fork protection component Swi3-domain-containing protein [Butyriboletus roseoflavus]
MSLNDIWDEPIASPPKPAPADDDFSPLKRPHQSLFFSDNDSDYERPPKRATPAPPPAKPDVDALFEDLDKDGEYDDLRYKPLAPALDLEKLAKEAEARHARARQTAPSQTLAGGSKTAASGGAGNDQSGKDEGKGKPGDGEKKGRKVLPKLDEERLVGPEGFPSLVKDIEGFIPKGKGNEVHPHSPCTLYAYADQRLLQHADLNRLLQVYQFWTHKMYPKTSFKDTVNRVEKLCHSKRMQVRLSVWRDEFKGVINDAKSADGPDVIDLTEPTLVGTEDDGDDKDSENAQLKSDRASSGAPSLPPASSEADDDDFDIDAVIRAEEERLVALRAAKADSGSPHTSISPTLLGEASSRNGPDASVMDVDEASLWDAFDEPQTLLDPLQSAPSTSIPVGDDEDMWNIVDEMEQGEQSKLAKTQIPLSGVNVTPSLDSTNSGNTSRATNDDDWDEMYS